MRAHTHIGLVCFFSANWWLGIVFQKIVHPYGELKLLSLPDDLKKLVVSGLKSLAKLALRFLPVLGKGRFPDTCDPGSLQPKPTFETILVVDDHKRMVNWSCKS